MVRKSSGHDAQQPYTLVVFYNGRVYNIPIRYIPSAQQYALGREKKGEEVNARLQYKVYMCCSKRPFMARLQFVRGLTLRVANPEYVAL